MDSAAVSHAEQIDKGKNSSKSKVSRSYTPLSLYKDSAVNNPGPIWKGNEFFESKMDVSVSINSIPLSFYTTILVYHPAPDPTSESKMDIFVPNDEKVCTPISSYMNPTISHPVPMRKNYIQLSDYTTAVSKSSESKVTFCTAVSKSSESKVTFCTAVSKSSESKVTFCTAVSKSSESKVTFCFQSSKPDSVAKIIFGSFGSPSADSKSESNASFGSFGSTSSDSKSESNVSFGSFGSQSSESKVRKISIPDIVAFSILSKLSIKSLKRFECVCKSWSILFENSDFMTTYSNHFISRHGSDSDDTFILTNLYVDQRLDQRKRIYVDLYHSVIDLLENNVNFNLPSPIQQRGHVTSILGSASVNGIFCVGQHCRYTSKVQYVLWNLLTDEFMVIPSSPAELPPNHPDFQSVYLNHRFHGFGYDQLRDDFKVIQYVSFISTYYPELTRSFFEIYSLKSNSWRMIDMDNNLSDLDHTMAFQGVEVYLDGACHWLISTIIENQRYISLLSFDLSDEVFLSTPIGEIPHSRYTGHERLTVLNGSIALIFNCHDDNVFHIYILGELGVFESWIKLYTYGPFPSIQSPPIGFGMMGYLFVKTKDYEVAYIDLSTRRIEVIGIEAINQSYNAGLYKESLLSLKDQVTSFSSSGRFHP